MPHWFTKHFPHSRPNIPWFIYFWDLPDGLTFEVGQGVVFYETRDAMRERFEDETAYVKAKQGRKGVVGIARVAGPIQRVTVVSKLRYEEDPHVRFRWEVPCEDHEHGTIVPYAAVKTIMQTKNPFIISSPVKAIDQVMYDAFREALQPLSPCTNGAL